MTHDRENRLKQYNLEGGALVDYVYDFSGRLLLRTDANGDKRKYYYDGTNMLLTRKKLSGAETCYRTASAFMLKDAPIGQIAAEIKYGYASGSCAQSPTSELRWYHYDHIGNVIGFSDANGQISDVVNMEAFGTVHQGGQSGIRLTTKEHDPASGLYYFGARWYNSTIGRWMQKEPLGFDGPNWYHFSYSSPIIGFDPNGLVTLVVRPLDYPGQGPKGGPAKHCYVRFADGSTLGFQNNDDTGFVGADNPVNWPAANPKNQTEHPTTPTGPLCLDYEGCVKDKMLECGGGGLEYSLFNFNCCGCARRALKQCQMSVAGNPWPNAGIGDEL